MEQIKERREGSTGIIELYNPPHNFMTARMVKELDQLTWRWEKDSTLRSIVITGGVPDIFITHYSVEELFAGLEPLSRLPVSTRGAILLGAGFFIRAWRILGLVPGLRPALEGPLSRTTLRGIIELDRIHRTFTRLALMDKVVIAAINGECMGGGCELALSCDFRLMAKGDYRIGLIEALAGIIPGAGGTQRMARVLGPDRAVAFILDGRLLDAEEAEREGLVHRAVAPEKLLDQALELAERMAGRPRASVRGVKRAVRLGFNLPLPAALDVEKRLFVGSGITDDARKAGEFYRDRHGAGMRARQIFDLLRRNEGVKYDGN